MNANTDTMETSTKVHLSARILGTEQEPRPVCPVPSLQSNSKNNDSGEFYCVEEMT